jgi:hypothetical protein
MAAGDVHAWHSKETAPQLALPWVSGDQYRGPLSHGPEVDAVSRQQGSCSDRTLSGLEGRVSALHTSSLHLVEERSLLLDRDYNRFECRLLCLVGGEFRRYRRQIRLQQIRLVRHQLRLLLRGI